MLWLADQLTEDPVWTQPFSKPLAVVVRYSATLGVRVYPPALAIFVCL